MIRCVRLWTGEDQNSYFEEGWLELETGPHADLLTEKLPATTVSFQETASGGALDWHTAPVRQLVITLSGNWTSRPVTGSTSCCTQATSCSPRIRLEAAIRGN